MIGWLSPNADACIHLCFAIRYCCCCFLCLYLPQILSFDNPFCKVFVRLCENRFESMDAFLQNCTFILNSYIQEQTTPTSSSDSNNGEFEFHLIFFFVVVVERQRMLNCLDYSIPRLLNYLPFSCLFDRFFFFFDPNMNSCEICQELISQSGT